MFTLFTGRHVGGLKRSSKWRLHTRLCNFVRNFSTNISALGRRTHLKFGELFSLFIVYYITIFWLCPLHTFWFYFLLRDSAHTLLHVLDPFSSPEHPGGGRLVKPVTVLSVTYTWRIGDKSLLEKTAGCVSWILTPAFSVTCIGDIFVHLSTWFRKETQNPLSDPFGFKNPILDFLKETHPQPTEG